MLLYLVLAEEQSNLLRLVLIIYIINAETFTLHIKIDQNIRKLKKKPISLCCEVRLEYDLPQLNGLDTRQQGLPHCISTMLKRGNIYTQRLKQTMLLHIWETKTTGGVENYFMLRS